MAHRRPAVWAIPWLVEGGELVDKAAHLGGVDVRPDHDSRATGAHGEHGAQLRQPALGGGRLSEERDELVHI